MPFDATGQAPWEIPFGRQDHAELMDWTGRQVRAGKRGAIDGAQPPILARLGLDGEAFIDMAAHLLKAFGTAVGAPRALARLRARRQTRFLHGMRAAQRVFG